MQYLMKTGKDYVRAEMPDETAQKIIKNGKRTKGDRDGYFCIDSKYYFEDKQTESEG